MPSDIDAEDRPGRLLVRDLTPENPHADAGIGDPDAVCNGRCEPVDTSRRHRHPLQHVTAPVEPDELVRRLVEDHDGPIGQDSQARMGPFGVVTERARVPLAPLESEVAQGESRAPRHRRYRAPVM